MELFHVIEGGVVHLRSKGLYRQANVYHRGRDVFAKVGAGFVRLHGHRGTTKPDIAWEDIEAAGVTLDNNGRPFFARG